MKALRTYASFLRKQVSRNNRLRVLGCGITALVIYAAGVVFPVIQRSLFAQIGSGESYIPWVIVLLAVGLLSAAMRFLGSYLKTTTSIKIQRELQMKLIVSGIETPNAATVSRGAGGYLVSIYGDCEQISNILSVLPVCAAVLSMAQILAILVITIPWSPILAAIMLPAYILIVASVGISTRVAKAEFSRFREILTKINPRILELLENRTAVLGYMGISHGSGYMEEMFKKRDQHVTKSNLATDSSAMVISFCALASQIVFIIFSAYRISRGSMEIGDFVALFAYLPLIFAPLTTVRESVQQISSFSVLQARICPFLKSEKKSLPERGLGRYTFENCRIAYEDSGTRRTLFEEFSGTIDCTMGIVGLSGSGKTTLIRTMLGNAVPESGTCRIGGCKANTIFPELLLSQVRYYPQVPEIFDNTLEFNIAFDKQRVSQQKYRDLRNQAEKVLFDWCRRGDISEPVPMDILPALFMEDTPEYRKAWAEFLSRDDCREMMAEYLTSAKYYVGSRYDGLVEALDLSKLSGRDLGMRGNTISGGEKNKIALARFLLPEHAGFFIMDEPFTNIDILSMKACLEAFEKFKPGNCGMVVSHNMQVIHYLCDRVMVMEEGQKPVVGSHDELMKTNKLFRALYEEYLTFNGKTEEKV